MGFSAVGAAQVVIGIQKALEYEAVNKTNGLFGP